jgi:transposase
MRPEATRAPRTPQQPRAQSALPPPRAAVNLQAAGLGVGAEAHDVAVPPGDDAQPVRRFGASTVACESSADGLAACGITTVAGESTGVSWLPLGELLEARGVEGRRVAPQPGHKIKGRPTSALPDGQGRQRLQPVGLLASAFRPPEPGGVLRRSLRQRAMVRSDASQHIPQRHKALTRMHMKRPHGVSGVTGETGMARLRAMRAGDRAPVQWARLRNDRGHHDEEPRAKARHGPWREEHLVAVAQAVALSGLSHQQSGACDRPSEAPLGTCAERQAREAVPPGSRPRQRPRNRPPVDVRGARPRRTGGDLPAIAGLAGPTALTILSESGLDLGRGPTVQHGPSRRGLCPPHRVAGGKVVSRGTQPCANRVATALRLAASCLPRRQSALAAFCRRMKARLGTPKAITATAHTLARLVYTRLRHGPASGRQRLADAAQHDRDRRVQKLTRRAKALGATLVQAPAGTPR